jgi:hypothetical protein
MANVKVKVKVKNTRYYQEMANNKWKREEVSSFLD